MDEVVFKDWEHCAPVQILADLNEGLMPDSRTCGRSVDTKFRQRASRYPTESLDSYRLLS